MLLSFLYFYLYCRCFKPSLYLRLSGDPSIHPTFSITELHPFLKCFSIWFNFAKCFTLKAATMRSSFCLFHKRNAFWNYAILFRTFFCWCFITQKLRWQCNAVYQYQKVLISSPLANSHLRDSTAGFIIVLVLGHLKNLFVFVNLTNIWTENPIPSCLIATLISIIVVQAIGKWLQIKPIP